MLEPKKTKWRSAQRGKMKGNDNRGATLAFGSFGIKSLEQAWVSDKQLEAARIALTRHIKREGGVWLRVFPDKPVTKKPLEVRMGKGKGVLDHWAAVVKPGRIILEMDGVTMDVAKEALHLAASKLCVKTRFVVRRDYAGE